MRILCTADIHIGRASSRIPDDLGGDHSSVSAWKRIVDLAIEERVDLVAVAGDIIDAAANYFHSSGPLQAGLERLSREGIHAVMIAGNHDHDSLKRFFEQFGSRGNVNCTHFLGSTRGWERRDIQLSSGKKLQLVGRSFGSAHQTSDPFDDKLPEFDEDGSTILGLLHADVDQVRSRYAACASARLMDSRPDIWLLGHIHSHKPFPNPAVAINKHIFYPGSPQSLDPGESGSHGVWILEISTGLITKSYHQLSSVYYEKLDIDIGGMMENGDPAAAVERRIRERLGEITNQPAPPRVVGFRVRLIGRTALHSALLLNGGKLLGDIDEFRPVMEGVQGFLEGDVTIDTRPAIDLLRLSAGKSPAALLAKLILRIESGEKDEFLESAGKRLSDAFQSMGIDGDSGGEGHEDQTPPDSRDQLLSESYRLLAELEEGRNNDLYGGALRT